MLFATIFGSFLVVTSSSAVAIPFPSIHVPGQDANAIVARDPSLVVRDVVQAVHNRELAELDARTM